MLTSLCEAHTTKEEPENNLTEQDLINLSPALVSARYPFSSFGIRIPFTHTFMAVDGHAVIDISQWYPLHTPLPLRTYLISKYLLGPLQYEKPEWFCRTWCSLWMGSGLVEILGR